MAMNIKIINPLEFQNWDDLTKSTEACSIFHSTAWARVLYNSYGYKPLYFTVIHDNELSVLVPLMEINSFFTGRRGVSLPFSDYCEPIIKDNNKIAEVLDYIFEYGKKAGWKSVELRPTQTMSAHFPHAATYYGHTLNLSVDEQSIFSNFRNSIKRNIRKAVKVGVTVKICHTLDSIKEYYRLHNLTRKKHGVPPQPFYFFNNIFRHIIDKNLGIVLLAYFKGNCVAGNVYFHYNNNAYYKYGASDLQYQDLRASNLVMWEAIKFYAQNNFQHFCFGRTNPNNKGLLQFKNGWGVEETVIKYFKYDLKKNEYVKEEYLNQANKNRLISHLPFPLLKIVGQIFYKHIG
jgi:lipid II:glycine glycyltransferase (peptidoglycan interpeptide bridge formation enzyme)